MNAFRQLGCALVLFALVGGAGCSKKKELSVTGGTVTIEGTGFQEGGARGVKVYFGDKEAKVLGWIGDDKLKIEAPAGEIGQTVDILMVFDDAKDIKIEKAYKYEDVQKSLNVDALTGEKPDDTTPPPSGSTPPPSGTAPAPAPSGTAPAPAPSGTAPAPAPSGSAPAPAGGTPPAAPPADGTAPK